MLQQPSLNTIYTQPNLVNVDERSTLEWTKCRLSPFYFILNYVYLPEIGGKMKYTAEFLHPKFKRVIKAIMVYHMCILMASRQLGKSSIAACLLASCFAKALWQQNRKGARQ